MTDICVLSTERDSILAVVLAVVLAVPLLVTFIDMISTVKNSQTRLLKSVRGGRCELLISVKYLFLEKALYELLAMFRVLN